MILKSKSSTWAVLNFSSSLEFKNVLYLKFLEKISKFESSMIKIDYSWSSDFENKQSSEITVLSSKSRHLPGFSPDIAILKSKSSTWAVVNSSSDLEFRNVLYLKFLEKKSKFDSSMIFDSKTWSSDIENPQNVKNGPKSPKSSIFTSGDPGFSPDVTILKSSQHLGQF